MDIENESLKNVVSLVKNHGSNKKEMIDEYSKSNIAVLSEKMLKRINEHVIHDENLRNILRADFETFSSDNSHIEKIIKNVLLSHDIYVYISPDGMMRLIKWLKSGHLDKQIKVYLSQITKIKDENLIDGIINEIIDEWSNDPAKNRVDNTRKIKESINNSSFIAHRLSRLNRRVLDMDEDRDIPLLKRQKSGKNNRMAEKYLYVVNELVELTNNALKNMKKGMYALTVEIFDMLDVPVDHILSKEDRAAITTKLDRLASNHRALYMDRSSIKISDDDNIQTRDYIEQIYTALCVNELDSEALRSLFGAALDEFSKKLKVGERLGGIAFENIRTMWNSIIVMPLRYGLTLDDRGNKQLYSDELLEEKQPLKYSDVKKPGYLRGFKKLFPKLDEINTNKILGKLTGSRSVYELGLFSSIFDLNEEIESFRKIVELYCKSYRISEENFNVDDIRRIAHIVPMIKFIDINEENYLFEGEESNIVSLIGKSPSVVKSLGRSKNPSEFVRIYKETKKTIVKLMKLYHNSTEFSTDFVIKLAEGTLSFLKKPTAVHWKIMTALISLQPSYSEKSEYFSYDVEHGANAFRTMVERGLDVLRKLRNENREFFDKILNHCNYMSFNDLISDAEDLLKYIEGRNLSVSNLSVESSKAEHITTFTELLKNNDKYEEYFNKVQSLEEVGKKLGIDLGHGKDKHDMLKALSFNIGDFSFRMLNVNDFRHFTVGLETDCCQKIGGHASTVVMDSFINPLSGVLILEKDGNILCQSYVHYVPGENGYILDNIEWNKKNVEDLTNKGDLEKAYVALSVHMKELYDISYFIFGEENTKIDKSMFPVGSMDDDPRYFAAIHPRGNGIDFSHERFRDILGAAKGFEQKNIDSNKPEKKPGLEFGKMKSRDKENNPSSFVDNLKNACSLFDLYVFGEKRN